jgi:hypothetical protein
METNLNLKLILIKQSHRLTLVLALQDLKTKETTLLIFQFNRCLRNKKQKTKLWEDLIEVQMTGLEIKINSNQMIMKYIYSNIFLVQTIFTRVIEWGRKSIHQNQKAE